MNMAVLFYNEEIINVEKTCPSYNRMVDDGAEVIKIDFGGCENHASNENTVKVDGVWKFTGECIESEKAFVVAKIMKERDEQDAKPFEYPSGSGIFYKVTSAVVNTVSACVGLAGTDPIPVPNNGNCWDDITGTISTYFTVSEFEDFYKYGYSIPEHNYSTAKAHIANVRSLTDIEEVRNYDYKTNWK